jgi:hypothetical protein
MVLRGGNHVNASKGDSWLWQELKASYLNPTRAAKRGWPLSVRQLLVDDYLEKGGCPCVCPRIAMLGSCVAGKGASEVSDPVSQIAPKAMATSKARNAHTSSNNTNIMVESPVSNGSFAIPCYG